MNLRKANLTDILHTMTQKEVKSSELSFEKENPHNSKWHDNRFLLVLNINLKYTYYLCQPTPLIYKNIIQKISFQLPIYNHHHQNIITMHTLCIQIYLLSSLTSNQFLRRGRWKKCFLKTSLLNQKSNIETTARFYKFSQRDQSDWFNFY